LDWENDGIESRKCYEVARKYDLPIVVMEPLKGGFLVNVPEEAEKIMKEVNSENPVSWALRYVASLDGVFMVLSGSTSIEQLEENILIMDNFKHLTDEENEAIIKVTDIINSQITVPCTKCNYCLSSCPKHINIPKLFDWYNHEKIENNDGFTAVGNAYVNYSKIDENTIASDCISCGMCVKECPQHINIPEIMKDVKETFEIPLYGFTD
jgi:predicted aldo/keto reductase-like oxidoreductase